jgi:hypothetical protein
VIVDEGPGQSGSSFGAVADWLQERGVPLDSIAFVTSHDSSPGPKASNAHKRLWQEVRRVDARFDNSFLADRFGPLEPLRDGQRLKFHGERDGERVLLKFVGLGAVGERKIAMAKALHAAGWTAEPLALVHGFLPERWHEDARSLSADDRSLPEIASYIGARARLFPAAHNEGASIQQLFAMIRRNAELAVELNAVATLVRWELRLGSIAKRIVRARTDNRMDPRKWLRLPNGRVLKTDAIDHHCAHDLIGAQDIAWDVAGAAIEFDLNAKERAWLAAAVGRTAGWPVDPELLDFMTVAYVAFRLGQSQIAGMRAAADGYERRLRELLLEHPSHWKPQESALDGHAERTGAGTIQPQSG